MFVMLKGMIQLVLLEKRAMISEHLMPCSVVQPTHSNYHNLESGVFTVIVGFDHLYSPELL